MASYHVAAFAADGSLVGVGRWDRAALSPKWLAVAAELMEAATRSGRVAVPIENLSHVTIQVTRAAGAMLATYSAHGIIAASALMLTGAAPEVEADLLTMFVQSLRKTPAVARLGGVEPFAALFSLTERPLHVVVPWPQGVVSEDDHELIQQLSTHVAGAVLTAPD